VSYCTPSEIYAVVDQDKLKKMFRLEDDGSFPQAKVQSFIDTAELMLMKPRLGMHYTLPITGAQSLEILKGISLGLTVEALYVFAMDGNVPDRIKEMGETGRAIIKMYCGDPLTKEGKPTALLPDAPRHLKIATSVPDALDLGGT
jgi:hypothetical protein